MQNAQCARRDVQEQSMLQVIPLIENTPGDEPTMRSCRIKTHLYLQNALAAFCKWKSRSAFTASEVAVDNIHPSHSWHPSRSKTCIGSAPGINKHEGGCASVVKTFVLLAFKIKPTCRRRRIKLCSKVTASCADFANRRISSANRRSSKFAKPSCRSPT